MSLTLPQGFRAAGATAGLKPSGNPDVALVVNDGPAHAAAGVFTRNKVQAAPVLWSQQVLAAGRLRAVVLNSGGANACTGPQGFQTAHATAEKAAELLGCGADRGRGLLHRHHRRAAAARRRCSPGSRRPRRRWATTPRAGAPPPPRS